VWQEPKNRTGKKGKEGKFVPSVKENGLGTGGGEKRNNNWHGGKPGKNQCSMRKKKNHLPGKREK